jgi:hypothetical protein
MPPPSIPSPLDKYYLLYFALIFVVVVFDSIYPKRNYSTHLSD